MDANKVVTEQNAAQITDRTVAQITEQTATQTAKQTIYSTRMKQNFKFFGPATFLYAVWYAFCMFHNGSGVTFPFFVAGSLFYLCFSLSKLEISLKKGSGFYMVSMMLLAVSTFGTDDGRIIFFNKTGIFLLMMALLLSLFYDTSRWKLGKYLGSILTMVFCSFGELRGVFADCTAYCKEKDRKNRTGIYIALGIVIALPLLLVVTALLGDADVVFRQVTKKFFAGIRLGNVLDVAFRIVFLFLASYQLLAYLCKKTMREEVTDKRKGEPILAITTTTLLSVVYLVFSAIQIVYLFLGQMQLPEGYTYAKYAREGFFQLLAVSILNLVIVLVCMGFFRENKVLKIILTVMSLCTFIMIASSALRMIFYIQSYYLTFLRLLVLWGLALLFVLFVGITVSIYREKFPLFRYCMAVVTVLYIVLSFSHPDYIIATVNLSNEQDYYYLSTLNADAAPALIPYMAKQGYDLDCFDWEKMVFKGKVDGEYVERFSQDGFGYYYLERLMERCRPMSVRTYNISRDMAQQTVQKYRQ